MNRALLIATLAASLVATRLTLGQGRSGDAPGHQKIEDGTEQVPDSSIDKAEDHGHRAHTNHVVFLKGKAPAPPAGPSGYIPSEIVSAYNLPALSGSGVIAIVDAYDYPTALADFNKFSKQFDGLPSEPSTNATASSNAVFQVVYASGKKPSGNCGWNQEAALDIEWAHAMAPAAKIVLVEANSSSFADLFQGVAVANALSSVKQVSMSWGGNEFSTEHQYDVAYFTNTSVVYLAAAGDTAGQAIYPSTSPSVISAGGTSLVVSGSGVVTETAWGSSNRGTSGSGGGLSAFETKPMWQTMVSGSKRGTPDLSFDSDPATGVSVYDSTSCQGAVGWLVFGGTSVAAPSLAGIINRANNLQGYQEGSLLYSNPTNWYATDFRDITSAGGEKTRYPVVSGWDLVTGIGSPLGGVGK